MDFASFVNSVRANTTTPTSNFSQFTGSPYSDESARIQLAEMIAQINSGFDGFSQHRPQPSWNTGFQSNVMSNFGLPRGCSYYQPSVSATQTQTQTQTTSTSTAPNSIFNRQFPTIVTVPGRKQPSTVHEALDDWLSEKTKISKNQFSSHSAFLDSRATIKEAIDESLSAWSQDLDSRFERTTQTLASVLSQARSRRLKLGSLESLSEQVDELNQAKNRFKTTVNELIGFDNKLSDALDATNKYARFSSAQVDHREGTMTEEVVDTLRSDYKGLSYNVNGTAHDSHWDQFKKSGLSLAYCPPILNTNTNTASLQNQSVPTSTTFNNPYSLYGAFGNTQPQTTSQFGVSASQREDQEIDFIARSLESSGQYQAARELRAEYQQEKTMRTLTSLGLGPTQTQTGTRTISIDHLFNGL